MKFRIELDDQAIDYRATAVHEFHSELFYCDSDGYRFFVDGKEVSKTEAFDACQAAFDAAWAKKQETHKRISVCKGVTTLPNNYREIWVRK